MANTVQPKSSNILNSGRELKIATELEFNSGLPVTTNQVPIVKLVAESIEFNQVIDFVLNVADATTDENLWEATDEDNRARAVVISCEYGVGAITINPDGAPVQIPMSADATAGNAFLVYVNPSGAGITVGATPTGPGINKINVSTELEARFNVYIFI